MDENKFIHNSSRKITVQGKRDGKHPLQCEHVSQSRGYTLRMNDAHEHDIHEKPFPLISLAKCAIRCYNATHNVMVFWLQIKEKEKQLAKCCFHLFPHFTAASVGPSVRPMK